MTNGGPICLSFFLFFFFFSFLCAKICMCSLNFGSDSILIREIYFYFSYYPHKIYINIYMYVCVYIYIYIYVYIYKRHTFFSTKKKKKDILNWSFRSLPIIIWLTECWYDLFFYLVLTINGWAKCGQTILMC